MQIAKIFVATFAFPSYITYTCTYNVHTYIYTHTLHFRGNIPSGEKKDVISYSTSSLPRLLFQRYTQFEGYVSQLAFVRKVTIYLAAYSTHSKEIFVSITKERTKKCALSCMKSVE